MALGETDGGFTWIVNVLRGEPVGRADQGEVLEYSTCLEIEDQVQQQAVLIAGSQVRRRALGDVGPAGSCAQADG